MTMTLALKLPYQNRTIAKTKTKINIPSVPVTSSFSKRYTFDGFGDKVLAPEYLHLLSGILQMTTVN